MRVKKKNLLLCISSICLLLTTLAPQTLGTDTSKEITIPQQDDHYQQICVSKQDTASISCDFYGFPMKNTHYETTMSLAEAETFTQQLFTVFQEMERNAYDQNLANYQNKILKISTDSNLLPTGLSSHTIHPLIPSQNRGKNMRNPSKLLDQEHASEYFCNYLSFGTGSAMPVIVLPRLIPILLTPIPRVFFKWNAAEGYTSAGGIRSGTGFMASGNQEGIALGFWGMGFSIFIPPVQSYGIFGYALYCSVDADDIKPWPPNYPPVITPIYPPDNGLNIPVGTSELQFKIEDENLDLMSYTVATNPDVGGGNQNNVENGIYTILITNLEGTQTYEWTVTVTDGENVVDNTFTFSTEPVAPIISNPSPADGSRFIPIDTTMLQFYLNDPQGDKMDYTVETSPYIGSGTAIEVPEGYYTISIDGLQPMTEYRWYVNVTDGAHWKHAQFGFQTEPLMHFDPFTEGWQFRKNITINQSKIAGDLNEFPVMVSIIDPDLIDTVQSDGDDILFMDDAGVAQRLWHEIEQYNPASGTLVCWINIPEITTTATNTFYVYYGNPTADSQQYPEQVWNDHYMGVWHLHTSPSMTIYDSTKNNNDGTSGGGMSTNNLVLGKTGIATDFDGINDYIKISDSSSLKPQDITLSAWYKPYIISAGGYLVSKSSFDYWGNSDGHTYGFNTGNNIAAVFEKNTNEQVDIAGNYIPSQNQWQHLTLGYNETSATGNLYVNGVLNGFINPCHSTVLWYYKPWDFLIGASKQGTGSGKTPTHFQNCALDEIRVLDTALSGKWIQTEYFNQQDPQNFYTIGLEESTP
ncbi:MAG: DUF2341 domain-containing protein [Candidatus Thermoplasmatota archaeon]|nr:DUF2341 domain-containing protein [Candidatus Thermoplasmatota archaeon]